MESKKNDRTEGKLRWELLPIPLMEKLVEVYEFGANKYGPNTWQELEDGEDRYLGAMFRHLNAHKKGEKIDPESGLLHVQHMAWNAIAIMYTVLHKEENHDKC